MFSQDFYPTPRSVIEKMLLGVVDVHNKIILEPSAGKGNIVDYLIENGAKEVLTCENNADLAKIVATKSRLIADDFLTLKSENVSHIDLIVMNPPFSADEKHILHAWEIAPAGCQIISLCNLNTITNPFSQDRKALKEIIESNGRYEDFGECFNNSERQTNVQIGCIFLFKQGEGENEFEGYFDLDEDDNDKEMQPGIVKYDFIRDIVGRYVRAVSLFDSVMDVSNEINEMTRPISKYGIKFGGYRISERNFEAVTRNEFKKDLQKQCWEKIFDEMKMDKYITTGVRGQINNFVEKQIHVPFTVKNVYKMIEMVVGTHGSRMDKTIINVFEMICRHSADNKTEVETWKTNSNYMLNKRFIVPYMCDGSGTYGKDKCVTLSFMSNYDDIDDILRVLCYLTATDFDSIQDLRSFTYNTTNLNRLHSQSFVPMEWGKWYDWEPFFKIRGYKKGTMHFEFLDEKVWALFNQRVAKIKGYQLPNNIKTRRNRRRR